MPELQSGEFRIQQNFTLPIIDPITSYPHINFSGQRFVIYKDPGALENVVRAEGKYRRRDFNFTDGMNWLSKNRMKQLPTLSME